MPEVKPTISFDDFTKLDIRIAKVLEASDHPNADKLICMKIDIGGEERQIIAGLRPFCAAAALVGKEIVVVVNMAPRKMRGLESNGMLLAATVGGEQLTDVVVLTPDKQVPPGSPVS